MAPLSTSAMLSKLQGDIRSGGTGQTTRRKASRVSVGFRHALDWGGNGIDFVSGAAASGMTNWIGGGVDSAKAGVIARLIGESSGSGRLTGKSPDDKMSPMDIRGQERMEYLVAAHNMRGQGSSINTTIPTRRWIYGRPRHGKIPTHSAGDAKQPQLEKLMEHYISRSSGDYKGSGSALQPVTRLWNAFYRRFEAYMRATAPTDLSNIMSQLDPSDEGEGFTSEGMQTVLDRIDSGGPILGDSHQEIAGDLTRNIAHTTDLQGQAHTQLGGAQRFDQIFEAGTTFEDINGRQHPVHRIADVAEGDWFAKKAHHGIGGGGARRGSTGYDLSDPQDIREHYNSNRIPMYRRIHNMIIDFARQAAGEPPLNASGLVVGTEETPQAWYRRQAVFYGTQLRRIVSKSDTGSKGENILSMGFGDRSRGGIFYDSQAQRLDTFGLNPYAQRERGNMPALRKVMNDAIGAGIMTEWFSANEKISYDDLVFVLHHMGSVGALYDDLLTNGNLIVNEYSEIMAFGQDGNEWTLIINFSTDSDGQFNLLGVTDVAIIPQSLEQIYMESLGSSSQLENDNALDAAVLSVGMSRMRGWLIPETAKGRMIQKSHRFTCKADAAIPGQMNALVEAFMMIGDNAAASYVNQLQSDMRGVSVSFSSLLRGSVLGQLRGRWPTYAWGSGAAGPHGSYASRNPDLVHSPSTHPPALYVGPRRDAGVGFYPQHGDPYFETRAEYASRVGEGFGGWPGDWFAREARQTTSGPERLQRSADKADAHGMMGAQLGESAYGSNFLREQMTAAFGHTDWLDAMTEGMNVFGTQTSQEEAAEIVGQGRARSGYFIQEASTVGGRGVLAGQTTPEQLRERMAEAASGRTAGMNWIPNTSHNRQLKALTSDDLGFIWALPYATWGYAQLGGSRGDTTR